MTTDVLEILAEALGTFDRRLSDIDIRFVDVEKSIADDAQASEDTAKSVHALQCEARELNKKYDKLIELYKSIDATMTSMNGMVQNFVIETQRLRTSSQQLISEVRAKSG